MTEIHTLLGLDRKVSGEKLREEYQRQYADLVGRIDHAPTEKLKLSFQQRLEELTKAWQVYNTSSGVHLPASKPTLSEKDSDSPSSDAKDNVDNTKSILSDKSTGKRKHSLLFAWGLLSFAAALLFLILWIQNRGELQDLQTQKTKMDQWEALFTNGQMTLKNQGDEAFYLVYYELWYLDENQEMRRREKGPDQDNQWITTIDAGRSYTDEEYQNTEVVYAGEVLFYHLILADQEGNPKSYAGFVNQGNEISIDPKF